MKDLKSFLRHFSLSAVILFYTSLGDAHPQDLLRPDFYLGKGLSGVLQLAGTAGYKTYRVIHDPELEKRLEDAKNLILKNPAHNYRFKDISLVVIAGKEGEPNAFSLGPTIFVTQSMGKILNDRELTAVLAHEIAHSQKAHLVQRIPVPLGALFYEIGQILKNPKENATSFKKTVEMIQETIDTVHLATEIQADCLAAQQLQHLQNIGYDNTPDDLNGATNKLYGEDVTTSEDDYGDPAVIRAKIVKSRQYEIFGCDILN